MLTRGREGRRQSKETRQTCGVLLPHRALPSCSVLLGLDQALRPPPIISRHAWDVGAKMGLAHCLCDATWKGGTCREARELHSTWSNYLFNCSSPARPLIFHHLASPIGQLDKPTLSSPRWRHNRRTTISLAATEQSHRLLSPPRNVQMAQLPKRLPTLSRTSAAGGYGASSKRRGGLPPSTGPSILKVSRRGSGCSRESSPLGLMSVRRREESHQPNHKSGRVS